MTIKTKLIIKLLIALYFSVMPLVSVIAGIYFYLGLTESQLETAEPNPRMEHLAISADIRLLAKDVIILNSYILTDRYKGLSKENKERVQKLKEKFQQMREPFQKAMITENEKNAALRVSGGIKNVIYKIENELFLVVTKAHEFYSKFSYRGMKRVEEAVKLYHAQIKLAEDNIYENNNTILDSIRADITENEKKLTEVHNLFLSMKSFQELFIIIAPVLLCLSLLMLGLAFIFVLRAVKKIQSVKTDTFKDSLKISDSKIKLSNKISKDQDSINAMMNKEIIFELVNGTERTGTLKHVGLNQFVIEEKGVEKNYMKHAILNFHQRLKY